MLRVRGKENGDERFNIHDIIALIMIKDMLAKEMSGNSGKETYL